MSDRFEKLYSLPSQLYSVGAPVIVSAGSLLKDTQTGKVLAQLKLKGISTKEIKAVTVSLIPLDTAMLPLGEKETHQLLDLSAKRDEEFGQKTPFYFLNNATRAYQVIVEKAVFSDNTIWESNGEVAPALPAQELSTEAFTDEELEKQFKLEYGSAANYIADECADLWRCKCGGINHNFEIACHTCGVEKNSALSIDINRVHSNCASRVEKENQEQIEAEKSAQKKKRGRKRGIIILTVILLLLEGLNIFVNSKTAQNYKTSLINTKYIVNQTNQLESGRTIIRKGSFHFSKADNSRLSGTLSVTLKEGNTVTDKSSFDYSGTYEVKCNLFGTGTTVIMNFDGFDWNCSARISNGKIMSMTNGDITMTRK